MDLSHLPTLAEERRRPHASLPESRKRIKGRKQRAEAKRRKAIRAECVARDGDCRIASWEEEHPSDWHADSLEGTCDGRPEWAHLGEKKRARTRGQAPEIRHTTAGSLMLCTRHHRDYDAGRMYIEPLTDSGADGPLMFADCAITFTEVK